MFPKVPACTIKSMICFVAPICWNIGSVKNKSMYAYHAAPWSGHFLHEDRDRTTHHKRTMRHGREEKTEWTWEDILEGKGSWEEILAGKDHLPWKQVEAARKGKQLVKGPSVTQGHGWQGRPGGHSQKIGGSHCRCAILDGLE